MATPKSKSVAQIEVTPLPTHERTILSKHDYKNIKHPSTIKLISVVKTPEVHGTEDEKWTGLTKFELMEYLNDPFWVRVRRLFGTLFLISFLSIFLAAILIIVYTPKCTVQIGGTNSTTNSTDYVFEKGSRTRECKVNSDCGGIQNTTCMSDPRDNKMRCLCFDSSPPINGACPNRPRGTCQCACKTFDKTKTLHATCTSDSQCSEGLLCRPMNATVANSTKICMCPEEIGEKGGNCNGAFSISANVLTGLVIALTVLSVNHWRSYRQF